jgi:BlaI family transcriptional regulator, penicillinase repressor
MTRESKKPSELSTAEWAVMKVVWDAGAAALGDIHERVAGERQWAYSTVKTLVRRLVAKGWLEYQEVGNSFLYRPAVSRGDAVRAAIGEFSNRVLDGLLSPFVAYYAEQNRLKPDDLTELERIVRKHRQLGRNGHGERRSAV